MLMAVCNAGTSVWGRLAVAVWLELGLDPYFHGECWACPSARCAAMHMPEPVAHAPGAGAAPAGSCAGLGGVPAFLGAERPLMDSGRGVGPTACSSLRAQLRVLVGVVPSPTRSGREPMWESKGYIRVKRQTGGFPGIRTGSRVGPPFPSSPFSRSVPLTGWSPCALVWGNLSDLVVPPPGGFPGGPRVRVGLHGAGAPRKTRGLSSGRHQVTAGAHVHTSAKHGAPHLAALRLFRACKWGRAWSKGARKASGKG